MNLILLTLFWFAVFACLVFRYTGIEAINGFYHIWKSVILAKDYVENPIDGAYALGAFVAVITVIIAVVGAVVGVVASYSLL